MSCALETVMLQITSWSEQSELNLRLSLNLWLDGWLPIFTICKCSFCVAACSVYYALCL